MSHAEAGAASRNPEPGGEAEPIVECVPNFAEGRDRGTVHAILSSMRLPGVLLLDYSLDEGQNRSVITIAGPPDSVCEAAVRAAGVAAERIDLTRQVSGPQQKLQMHPRMGAADVIPFVPINKLALVQCAMLAREAAAALWERYGVPAYLYEAAASRPDRARLEELRHAQFEGLREAVLRDPSRRPDIGGPALHPTAGASAIGARRVLIEYKVLLEAPDLGAARAVARAAGAIGGGLAGVRAYAMLVDGVAQVAISIPNYEQTSPEAVHAAVLASLEKSRASMRKACLVGLLPEAAFRAAGSWVAHLDNFVPDEHILERRLRCPLPWPAEL